MRLTDEHVYYKRACASADIKNIQYCRATLQNDTCHERQIACRRSTGAYFREIRRRGRERERERERVSILYGVAPKREKEMSAVEISKKGKLNCARSKFAWRSAASLYYYDSPLERLCIRIYKARRKRILDVLGHVPFHTATAVLLPIHSTELISV